MGAITQIEHVFVGGLKVATASRAELAQAIIAHCFERRQAPRSGPTQLLFDSNGQGISLAARDSSYRAALEAADVVHADGGFIVTASRFLAGAPIAGRSATTDLIHDVIAAGLPHGLSHYLLGGTEEVNASCADRLRELHPGVVIAGKHHGYFDSREEARIVERISAIEPDVVWVGLGKPREQLFALRNRDVLQAGWAITCGGCFNYITGHYRRAPKWMQEHNLEWLFRAFTSPALLWRYAITSPHALWLTLSRADRRTIPGDRISSSTEIR